MVFKCHLRYNKKIKNKKKSFQNVFDSRTYFGSGESTGSTPRLHSVKCAHFVGNICALLASVRTVSPPTPSLPVAFRSSKGLATVKRSCHVRYISRTYETGKKHTLDLLLNCVIVPINLQPLRGDLSQKGAHIKMAMLCNIFLDENDRLDSIKPFVAETEESLG